MDTDVIIIGSGQGGVPLATKLASQGKRVVVIERAALGGTCVNTGCTPTKTMIASAKAAHVARTASGLGVRVTGVTVDLAAVVDRKDAVVARWRQGVERRLASAGDRVTVVKGHARFVGPRTVEVAGQRLTAAIVVINVGARAVIPDLPGLDSVPWLDNATVMQLRELPRRLLVLGGGYIGCEMGQMFRRFGAPVTIVGNAPHLLPREDEAISRSLEAVFRQEEIELRLGVVPAAVERGDGDPIQVRLQDGTRIGGSHLLVATGRQPNTDDLGCQAAGVARDDHGHVRIDDHYRTTAPGVYALGDAVEGPQFTHTSWDDHRRLLAVLTAVAQGREPTGPGRSSALTPFTVFTDPPVAGVGLSERQARDQGVRYELAEMPFGDIARAIESGQTAGVLRVLVDPATDQILGAHIVGAEAGELIHVFATMIKGKVPAQVLIDSQVVHPTFAEGLQSVLMRLPSHQS